MKYCQFCGSQMQDNSVFCCKCGKGAGNLTEENRKLQRNEKRCDACGNIFPKKMKKCPKCGKREKGMKGFSVLVILASLILILMIFILTLPVEEDSGAGSYSSEPVDVSQSEGVTNSVLYEDEIFTVEYLGIDDVVGVTSTYLQLRVTNNGNQKLTLLLDNVYINDIAVESGTGMPIELESGKISQTPFILFSGNTGLGADDIEKIEFELKGYDDNFDVIHSTDKITILK